MYLQTGKKTHSWLPDFSFLIWNKPRSSPTCLLEEVLVQTPLRGHLCRVVVWADPELEVPHVVGRQLHPHLDGLTTDVPPDKNALPIHPTSFIVTRLKRNYSVLSHQRFWNFMISCFTIKMNRPVRLGQFSFVPPGLPWQPFLPY